MTIILFTLLAIVSSGSMVFNQVGGVIISLNKVLNMSHFQSGGVLVASLVFLLGKPGLPHNLAGDDVHGRQDTKVWQICPHVQVGQNMFTCSYDEAVMGVVMT